MRASSVLIDPGDDDEIVDSENYRDIRIELQAIGHNMVCGCLSCVLLSPLHLLLLTHLPSSLPLHLLTHTYSPPPPSHLLACFYQTSVLMNPRTSLLDEVFDEFAADQRTPVEFASVSSQQMGVSSHGNYLA